MTHNTCQFENFYSNHFLKNWILEKTNENFLKHQNEHVIIKDSQNRQSRFQQKTITEKHPQFKKI